MKITSLPKESVVHAATVSVSGITSQDALVSINGILVDVNGRGEFTSSISLEEGANLVEISASDFKGGKTGLVLTVIYIP